jgi:uncharacterized membrane protein YedE/YeeE
MDKKYWNPYLGGFMLGTMLFLTFAIASQGFGASGTFSRLTAQMLVNGDQSWMNNLYVASYFKHSDNALINWTVWETVGIFIGGFVSALLAGRLSFRADRSEGYSLLKRFLWALIGGTIVAFSTRFARGCTSGQGMDGMATFSVGAWIFMLSVFAAGLIFSPLFRKQWGNDRGGE